MELNVVGVGQESTVSVSDAVFGAKFNEPLVHQAVVAYLANGRSGTRAQKTRSEVQGGGAKPWRQKGTGRARAGTNRSPIWRGGGVTFAAKPADHAQKINKKMTQTALRSVLSELVRQERLIVVDNLSMAEPKTKLLVSELESLIVYNVLIIVEKLERNLELAARNLHRVTVLESGRVDLVSLLKSEKVLMTTDALKSIEARLA